jgi:cell division septation protein DedD
LYFFAWDGFRPRAKGLDQPVTFPSDSLPFDSLAGSSTTSGTVLPPVGADTALTTSPPPQAPAGFIVSFAALLSEEKALQVASAIKVGDTQAHVLPTTTGTSPIFRVVMGPYLTRQEAERIGRASRREYWIYEGSP